MPHEHPNDSEQREQELVGQPAIDFTRMAPEEGVALIDALGAAYHAHKADAAANLYGDLLERIANDVKHAAEHSEDGLAIYTALMSDTASEEAVNVAAYMAIPLLRKNLDSPDIRQQITQPLLNALHNAHGLGEESAEDTLADLVDADWLDEPTARNLNEHLPEHRQRW